MTSYIQENNSIIEPVILNMYTANIAIIFELSIHSKDFYLAKLIPMPFLSSAFLSISIFVFPAYLPQSKFFPMCTYKSHMNFGQLMVIFLLSFYNNYLHNILYYLLIFLRVNI